MVPPSATAAGRVDAAEPARGASSPTPDPQPPEPASTLPPLSPASVATPAGDPDGVTSDLYLPRGALSQGPSVIGWVDVPFPDTAAPGHYRAELTLFIDEQGTVRRVRVDRGDAPALLQDAARQAFLNARFQPGEIDGRAVKSRLRIEVEFSAEGPAPR